MPVSLRTANILTILSFVFICHAILLAIFRIWHRLSTQRFWWEDVWAGLALLFAIVYLSSGLIVLYASISSDSIFFIANYWLYTYLFTCISWAVRMSLVSSIVRLVPPTPTRRRLSIALGSLFTMMFTGLMIQKTYVCGVILSWETHCYLIRSMVIFEACCSCITDTTLLVAALHLLRNIKLPRKQRTMIACLFSSSILISMGSSFNFAMQLAQIRPLITPAINIEVAISLAVCNLLVIVTFIYRLFHKEEEDDSDSSEVKEESNSSGVNDTSRQTSLPIFTTIDLGQLTNADETIPSATLGQRGAASSGPDSSFKAAIVHSRTIS